MAPRTIPIDTLVGQLLLKPQGSDDYGVFVEAGEHGRLTVGRIMRVRRASGRTAWFWTVTGPAEPEAGIGLAGKLETLRRRRWRSARPSTPCSTGAPSTGTARSGGMCRLSGSVGEPHLYSTRNTSRLFQLEGAFPAVI